MRKFSKLIAVVLAIAVIICPMMSVVSNAAGTNGYKLEKIDATNFKLTVSSDDGFIVYLATVNFDSATSFNATDNTNSYINGVKVIDYTLKSGSKNNNVAPYVSANPNGSALTVLVTATDDAALPLYTSIEIGLSVKSGSSATLGKIQAADDGDGQDVTSDPTLLAFPGANATTGAIDPEDSYAKVNATTATCDHTFAEVVDSAYIKTAKTCTAYAVYYKSCTKCNAASSETFEDVSGGYASHTTVDTKTNPTTSVSTLKDAATCTDDAVYYQYCSVCKQTLSTTWTDVGSKTGHDMTFNDATDSTCIEKGHIAYYSCGNCLKNFADELGNTELNNILKEYAAHVPAETETYIQTAATCTGDAVYYHTCATIGCGIKLDTTWTKTNSRLGHDWTEYTSNNDATCTDDGTKTRTCKRAGCEAEDTVTDAGTKLGHDYTYQTNDDGTHTIGCSRCTYGDQGTCDTDNDGACSKCGYKEATVCTQHTLAHAVYEVNVATSCYDMVTYCSVCNEEVYRFETTIPSTTTVNDIEFAAGCGLSTSAQFSYKVTKASIPTGCTAKVQIYRQSTNNSYNFENINCGLFDVSLAKKTNYVYFSDIALCQLTLPVAAYLCVYDGSNNLVSVSQPTVDIYVDMLWALYSKETTSAAMKTCFIDLLNVGSECQTLFAPAGSDLANEPLAIEKYAFDKSLATENLPDYQNVPDSCDVNPSAKTNTSVHALTPSVSISSGAPVVAYYIAGTKADKLDKTKLSVSISWTDGQGKPQQVNVAGTEFLDTTKNRIYYTLSSCALYDTNKAITAVFTYDGDEMYTSTYSVDTYVSNNYSNPTIGGAMTYIGKLGASARVLFGLN